MKNYKQRILIALCILVAIIIIGLVFYSSSTIKENFAEKQTKDAEEKQTKDAKEKQKIQPSNELKLSDKEQEIFNDLLNNKLTDINIDTLINSGVLTENMIEKFLNKMKTPSNANANANPDESMEGFENFVIDHQGLPGNINVPKDLRIEAFTGFTSLTPMYATAKNANTDDADATISTTNRIYSQYY